MATKSDNFYSWLDNNKRTVIIVIIILIVLVILSRNWYKIQKFLQPKAPANIVTEDGQTVVDPARKPAIYAIASDLYQDIYSTGWLGHVYGPYKMASALPDIELRELARYYKRNLSGGNTLWNDIESQWYITSSEPEKLQTRLAQIGEK